MYADYVFCGIESRSLCQWDDTTYRGAFPSSVNPVWKCSHSHATMCLLDGFVSSWQSRWTITLVKLILWCCHTYIKYVLIIYTPNFTSVPLLQNPFFQTSSPPTFINDCSLFKFPCTAMETISVWETVWCESCGEAVLRVALTSAPTEGYAGLAQPLWHWGL